MIKTFNRLFGADQQMGVPVTVAATVFVLALVGLFFGCKLYINSL